MRTILIAFLMLTASTTAIGQQRPDFSGQWVQIAPSSSGVQTVRQDAKTLSIRHDAEGGSEHAFSYRLDGTETRNAIPSHDSQIVSVSKAEWVGNRLRITGSSTYPDGRKLASVQEWSLDQEGRLVIELTETMAGGKPSKQVVVHRRAN